MNNKFPRSSHYHSRRRSNLTPFSLNLTDSDDLTTSLFYSNTRSKLIALDQIEKEEAPPEVEPFAPLDDGKKLCGRRDCVDRKFEAIRKLSRSTPNVKLVSPKKVDIVLSRTDSPDRKREPCIHSARLFSRKASPERDLLKEFKLIEEMRKELRSRNFQNSSRASFYVSASGRTEKAINLHRSSDNPERSSLYA
jgi:hypothetical protein